MMLQMYYESGATQQKRQKRHSGLTHLFHVKGSSPQCYHWNELVCEQADEARNIRKSQETFTQRVGRLISVDIEIPNNLE